MGGRESHPQLLAHPQLLPGTAPPPSVHPARSSCQWRQPELEQASLTAGSLTASFFFLLPPNILSFLQGPVPSSEARERNSHSCPFSFLFYHPFSDGWSVFFPFIPGYLHTQEADTLDEGSGDGVRRLALFP